MVDNMAGESDWTVQVERPCIGVLVVVVIE